MAVRYICCNTFSSHSKMDIYDHIYICRFILRPINVLHSSVEDIDRRKDEDRRRTFPVPLVESLVG